MNSVIKRSWGLLCPQFQQCRYPHKWHSKRPRPKIIERRVFEAITVPILPEMLKKNEPYCNLEARKKAKELLREDKENLYEKFLLKQCQKMFDENQMIIWFQKLHLSRVENRHVAVLMKKNGFRLHYHQNDIMRQVMEGTKWQNLIPLLIERNVYLTAPEPKVKEVFKILKKIPHLVMLCGVVDNQILSKAGLERYAALPPKDILLGQTVSTLNMAASQTRSLLSSHQQKLTQNLSQYLNDQKGEQPSSESTGS